MMIYLDNAADTPVLSEILDDPILKQSLMGNPSALHTAGRYAKGTVDIARGRVAEMLRSGVNAEGKTLRFLMNYSSEEQTVRCPWRGTDLLTGTVYEKGDSMDLPDWGVRLIEEG